jgi:hypothetical protein
MQSADLVESAESLRSFASFWLNFSNLNLVFWPSDVIPTCVVP